MKPTPLSHEKQIQKLKDTFGSKLLQITDAFGDISIEINKKDLIPVMRCLRDLPEFSFNQIIDLTAVDYLEKEREDRFQMVYHLFSLNTYERLRVKCNLTAEEPAINSLHELWKCVDWYERECYDMYGITFIGHPNLQRILMYEGFEGHPLRKDYEKTHEQPRVKIKYIPERHGYMEEFE